MKKTNDTPMEDFQALYNRQVNRVYRLALVMLGSQSDAEDMVQMVFLKVWEKKISFRDTDHETAWILTATKNQCKDVLKSYERKHCGTLEEMPGTGYCIGKPYGKCCVAGTGVAGTKIPDSAVSVLL